MLILTILNYTQGYKGCYSNEIVFDYAFQPTDTSSPFTCINFCQQNLHYLYAALYYG